MLHFLSSISIFYYALFCRFLSFSCGLGGLYFLYLLLIFFDFGTFFVSVHRLEDTYHPHKGKKNIFFSVAMGSFVFNSFSYPFSPLYLNFISSPYLNILLFLKGLIEMYAVPVVGKLYE